jgi:hypothetical protein
VPEKAALIAVLILERPLCLNCVAEKSELTADEVKSYLSRVRRSVTVERGIDRCRSCDTFTAVYSLSRKE